MIYFLEKVLLLSTDLVLAPDLKVSGVFLHTQLMRDLHF